jgi:hypothetical protein
MAFCHCFRVSSLLNFSSHQFYPKDVNLGPSHNNFNFQFLIYKPSILKILARTLSKQVCGWGSHLVPGPLFGNGPLLGPYPTLKICGCSYLSKFWRVLTLGFAYGSWVPASLTYNLLQQPHMYQVALSYCWPILFRQYFICFRRWDKQAPVVSSFNIP